MEVNAHADVRAFSKDSTPLLRLKKRLDELRARGVKSGAVGSLNRLIKNMERPLPAKGTADPKWFCTPGQIAGGKGKSRAQKQPENKKKKGKKGKR